jgi:hypothetical protein
VPELDPPELPDPLPDPELPEPELPDPEVPVPPVLPDPLELPDPPEVPDPELPLEEPELEPLPDPVEVEPEPLPVPLVEAPPPVLVVPVFEAVWVALPPHPAIHMASVMAEITCLNRSLASRCSCICILPPDCRFSGFPFRVLLQKQELPNPECNRRNWPGFHMPA